MRCFFLKVIVLGLFPSLVMAGAVEGSTPSAGAAAMNQTLMLVVLFVAFYFMLIRPQTKRAKAHQQLIQKIAEGDEVITSGGVMGRIVKLADDHILLAVAQGVTLKVQRGAITQALPKGTLKEE